MKRFKIAILATIVIGTTIISTIAFQRSSNSNYTPAQQACLDVKENIENMSDIALRYYIDNNGTAELALVLHECDKIGIKTNI